MKYSHGWKRRNNIFLYSRTSGIAIYIRVSFTHTDGLSASIILRGLNPNKYLGKLISFLDPVLPTASRTDFVTCWHAKTDGWATSTFHGNCDGRGPTVTIIKVNEYIFGGYTDVSWSGGTHIKFLMRGQDNFIGSTIILLEFKGGRELEEILNDAPLIIALNLYYFIIVFWPSRFIHTYIVYRNFPIWYTCRTTLHPRTSSNNNTLTKGVICFKSQNFLLAFLQRKPLNRP